LFPIAFSLTYDDPPADPPAGDPPADPPAESSFTQADIDRARDEARTEFSSEQKKLTDEISALQKKQSLTADERKSYESKIEELRRKNMTADELAEEERQRIKTAWDEERTHLTSRAESAESKYASSSIRRSITDAAVSNEALVPEQLVFILERDAKVVEVEDAEGNKTGRDEVRVAFQGLDKDKNPVTLDLTVDEAVKKMTEMDQYLNLFKGSEGGIGRRQQRTGNDPTDAVDAAKSMSPEEYQKARREGKITLS
jgi:hypothetical protein